MGCRSDGPFVALTLSALPQSMIERELFGHEKGAFTDAKEKKPGYIEQANRGILFLDDINTAPVELQIKLLRFLEERTFYRLGSTKPIEVDIQVISATNQNLFGLVKEGKFREDLYYRINTVEIHLPPLRERTDDIPLLVNHFLGLLQKQGRTHINTQTPESLETMLNYHWPGNIRELKNAVEKAALYAGFKGHDRIEREDLSADISNNERRLAEKRLTVNFNGNGIDLDKEKARFELAYIESALLKSERRKTEAWKLLGLNDRFALRRRVKSITKRYPQLLDDFYVIQEAFSD